MFKLRGIPLKFFDYEALYLASHGDSSKLVKYFKLAPSQGLDFIVNPAAMWKNAWLTDRQLAEYIGLCSLRSYSDYKYGGVVDLPVDLLPKWVPLTVAQSNPLIKIENSVIKYLKEK